MQPRKDYPEYIDLYPVESVKGTIRLPGSKSISNRALLLASLSKGKTEILNLLECDDTLVMLMALTKLGVFWKQEKGTKNYTIYGSNGNFKVHHADLFMGNAGTVIRPLTAILAVMGGDYILHGKKRMHERPIGDLVHALNAAGTQITYSRVKNYPPLRIQYGTMDTQNLRIQVQCDVSSQFLTALLMAAPLMSKKDEVIINAVGKVTSKPYIDITLHLMEHFGVKVTRKSYTSFIVLPHKNYQSPGTFYVEGDFSSASYFLAAGAINGGPLRLEGIGKNSIQGDIYFIDALQKMGATIKMTESWIEVSSTGSLKPIDADFNHIPDAAMAIAIVALHAGGQSFLRNIASWQFKETNRISSMATELRKLGAVVEEGDDYLYLTPPVELKSAVIDTYEDHRIAMCFSLASLNSSTLRGATVRINNPQCVAKTFPEYFTIFSNINQSIKQ